jgi:hypothetical protein
MVEQVVDSRQQCAPSTSPVHRCSLPVPAELQVDAACQWRDEAAASAASTGTAAVAGVAAKKGGKGLNALDSGIGQLFLGSLTGGRTLEDARAVRANVNLVQIWANDGSGWTRSYEYVAPLGRALATRRSGRTLLNARERDASTRWRYPNARTVGQYYASMSPFPCTAARTNRLRCRHVIKSWDLEAVQVLTGKELIIASGTSFLQNLKRVQMWHAISYTTDLLCLVISQRANASHLHLPWTRWTAQSDEPSCMERSECYCFSLVVSW